MDLEFLGALGATQAIDERIIANERSRFGRFVLASNDKILDKELMLQGRPLKNKKGEKALHLLKPYLYHR